MHAGLRRAAPPDRADDEFLLDRLPGRDVGVMAVARPEGLVRRGPGAGAIRLGWMLDHHERSVRIGAEAMASGADRSPTPSLCEGIFVEVRWDSHTFVVHRDAFAHYPLFWTEMSSAVVISDSALALRRCRDLLGAPSQPSTDAVVARSLRLVIASQHMSPRTPCQEIRYVPAGTELCVGLDANGASAATREREFVHSRIGSQSSYVAELVRGARELAGSIQAIARTFPDRMLLSLSGGLDSRLLLSALALERDTLAAVEITTGTRPDQAADREVVLALADAHGFSVNNEERAARRRRATHPFGHWALSALGTYDQVILRTFFSDGPMLNLGGQGGEGLRGGPGQGSLRSLARVQPRAVGRALRREVRVGLDEIRVPHRDPHARRAHWLAYRSPLHAGLPVGQGAPFSHRPLNTVTLVALAVSPSNPRPYHTQGSLSLATDLLSVLGIDFARVPFVGSAQGLEFSAIESRHEELGRFVLSADDVDAYQVIGHPDDLAVGAPFTLLALVKDYRVPGASHDQQTYELSVAAWHRLEQSPLSKWYARHLEVVRRAGAAGFPAAQGREFRISAAKLLANDLWAN